MYIFNSYYMLIRDIIVIIKDFSVKNTTFILKIQKIAIFGDFVIGFGNLIEFRYILGFINRS